MKSSKKFKESTERKTTMERMIEMIKESYIEVMGIEKWNSLTAEEKHDVIMIIAKDALNNLK